jgi:ethanolamine utilization protein EutN
MIIGRISGEITTTIRHPAYADRKLLIVDRLRPDGTDAGGYLIAVDVVGAGVGQRVLVLDEGNGARQILRYENAPVRSVVVGIIDEVSLDQPD